MHNAKGHFAWAGAADHFRLQHNRSVSHWHATPSPTRPSPVARPPSVARPEPELRLHETLSFSLDSQLMAEVETDPEAGMFSAYMSHSPENVEIMKRFAEHVRAMVADEDSPMKFIEEHYDEIEWD